MLFSNIFNIYLPLSDSVTVPAEETVHTLVPVLYTADFLAVVLWWSSSLQSTPDTYDAPHTSLPNKINDNFTSLNRMLML